MAFSVGGSLTNNEEIKLRMQLADIMCDLGIHLYNASRAAQMMAELLELTDGEIKQHRVKSTLRDDAIDDLLKREGYTW